MKCRLVMEDWCKIGQLRSIYNTPLGVELSMGDMHSGKTFEAVVELSPYVAADIEEAWLKHGAYPVMRVMPNIAKVSTAKRWMVIDEGQEQGVQSVRRRERSRMNDSDRFELAIRRAISLLTVQQGSDYPIVNETESVRILREALAPNAELTGSKQPEKGPA